MASARVLCRNNCLFKNITQPVKWSVQNRYMANVLTNGISYYNNKQAPLLNKYHVILSNVSIRQYTNEAFQDTKPEPEKKPSVFQRLKAMYRDYWYVVVPVHVVTSAVWFGSFYYAVRSGLDVIAFLQTLGVSESLLTPLRESSAGYYALAFAMYKLVTPLRYAVTVGGTTYAIKKLTTLGWIKPVPSRNRLKEIIQEKKGNFQDRIQEGKQQYEKMKQKRTQVLDEVRKYKNEIKDVKNKKKC